MLPNEELVALAKKASRLTHSPYSHFPVGAVVVAKDGTIFEGANIENASYPLTMCAERNALYNAYMHGYKKEDLVALCIVADTEGPCSPCGACRQVISELYPSDAPIILGNYHDDIRVSNAKELLPFAFTPEDLNK